MELANSGAAPFLNRVLSMIARHSKMDGAGVALLRNSQFELIAGFNLPLQTERSFPVEPALLKTVRAAAEFNYHEIPDHVSSLPNISGPPAWNAVRFIPLTNLYQDGQLFIISGAVAKKLSKLNDDARDTIRNLATICEDELRLIRDVAVAVEQSRQNRTNDRPEPPFMLREERTKFEQAEQFDPRDTVTRFLLDTLVVAPRIRARNEVSYHALRRWRVPVKTEQISAFKALKSFPNEQFEESIVDELTRWQTVNFGVKVFDAVVPVPCGHSGPNCLSQRIAGRFSQRMGISKIDAFGAINVNGSSHPATNATRPGLRLCQAPPGDVLLLDDVATSGQHIEEAVKLLRKGASSVVAAAWIGDK